MLTSQLLATSLVDESGKLTRPWIKQFQEQAKATKTFQFVRSTHAARANILASDYSDGSEYYETDRGPVYKAVGGAWFYFSGMMEVAQAALPTDLTTRDSGLLVHVTDYAHLLRWSGAAWGWAPGEAGSGFLLTFVNPPAPPEGWTDASSAPQNVPTLLADGSIVFVNVPATPGSWYRQ